MKFRYFVFTIVILTTQGVVSSVAELNPLLRSSVPYKDIRVARVLAVDRLLLENDEKVVLIGLKPSKPVKFMEVNRDKHGFIIPDNDPTTPFDVEALRFASAMAEGKAVRLEFDAERRNADGILQAYVILPDGSLLNAELVRYGYADMRLVPPNMKYADKLRAAYQEARRELRGIQGQ